MRRFVLLTHRWLGLGAGAILAVTCVSGAGFLIPGLREKGIVGRVHETLVMGRAGYWIVVITTAVAVMLVVGGIILWWKRRILAVRPRGSLRRLVFDFHNMLGAIGFPLMILLSVTGIGMAFTTPDDGDLRRIIFDLHTARGYSVVIRGLYVVGTLAFAIQCGTGLLTWWRPRR